MATQELFNRQLPNVVCIQRVPYVVLCRPVAGAKIPGIQGVRVPVLGVSKNAKPPVGDFVQSVAVGVVRLEKSLSPPRKPVFEGCHHPVIVGYCRSFQLRHDAKSWVGAWWNPRARANPCGITAEAPSIDVPICI